MNFTKLTEWSNLIVAVLVVLSVVALFFIGSYDQSNNQILTGALAFTAICNAIINLLQQREIDKRN